MDRCIVITGANGALGRAMVSYFLGRGERVVGVDFDFSSEFLREIESNGCSEQWSSFQGDCGDFDFCTDWISKVGSFDGLVHCAGGFRFSPLADTSLETFDFLMQSNLRSSFVVLKSSFSALQVRSGAAVVIGANGALNPGAGMGPYAASKAGLHALVQSVAKEWNEFGVRINALLPSMIDSPANRRDMPDSDFSKWVAPLELARLADFLLNPESGRPVTGSLIPVLGGMI